MQAVYLISILVVVHSQKSEEDDKNCRGISVNGVNYEIELLKKGIDRPYLLLVDDENGDLYFSYSTQEDDESTKSAKINLYSKEYLEIEGVNNGFSTAINRDKSTIYIGGSDGIYSYDKNVNKAKVIAAKGNNIWTLFYKNKLYFSIHPTQIMYSYYTKSGKIERFSDLKDTKVDHFIIDANDTIYFTNETGLYTQKLHTKKAHLFQPFSEVGARALTLDKNGIPFICLQDGIYSMNKKNDTLKKLLHVDDAFGLAFDDHNSIIYSDLDSLVRLKKNENPNC